MGNDRKTLIEQKKVIAKKKFSQNFLLDENIINNIIEKSGVDNETGIIEIGPGLGALTKKLIKVAKKMLIYEIDSELIPYLNDFFKEYQNYKLFNKDILKIDVNKDIEEYFFDVNKIIVISNLPYHITTPIIMKFLEDVNGIDSLTLMMQLEVAKRITSEPNTKDYNALSVIIQHQTEPEYLFKVPKSVFYPKPNVDSAVIKLTIRKDIFNNEHKGFYKFVHACFSQRRKTLVNNLYSTYNQFTKQEFIDILTTIGINAMTRAEALELNDFIALYKHFNTIKSEEILIK
ncbi:16S rRNA (adenine(1518)-N(6)/adenine(1519)-N(6))-dimethyltransferase RsmA [Candidatus Izemoplasma sp. B36]|uniref:16S rRNA (adenine(1518)-N(6)/adenine(1519)-N(6))- dimethyltransferase RsmA n=1 Tax=Candidatus Izemoplasma sp. B36 TaxID=3242468 RepID=UPI003555F7E5